jgi:hypothetical protein
VLRCILLPLEGPVLRCILLPLEGPVLRCILLPLEGGPVLGFVLNLQVAQQRSARIAAAQVHPPYKRPERLHTGHTSGCRAKLVLKAVLAALLLYKL